MTKSTFFQIVVSEHRNYATIKSTNNYMDFPRQLDEEESYYLKGWFRENTIIDCQLCFDKNKTRFSLEVIKDAFFCPDALQERFTDLCAAESALFDHINFLFTPKF